MNRWLLLAVPVVLLLLPDASDAAVIKTMSFTGGSVTCEENDQELFDFWRCHALTYEKSGMLVEGGHFDLWVCERVGEFCDEEGVSGRAVVWEADLHDPPLRFQLTSGRPFDLLSINISL